jgi:hypothetical protein
MKVATTCSVALCAFAIIALTPATASAARWRVHGWVGPTTSVTGVTPTDIRAVPSIGIRTSSVRYPGAIAAGTTTGGTRNRRARSLRTAGSLQQR